MSKSISKNSQIEERERADAGEPAVFRFGPFLLDAGERVLRKGDTPLPLTPKAFDILLLLVSSHGRLVTKIRLLEEIWPDTFVEESTLTQNIFTLRKTLGAGEEGRQYIETVPKHGYRFRADVELIDRRRPRPVPVSDQAAAEPATTSVPPRPRSAPWIAMAIALGIVIVATILIFQRASLADTALRNATISRLTNGANVASLALAPDGRYVAYASESGDTQSLSIRQVGAPAAVEIVPPAPVTYRGITFSPDASWLYYVTVPHDTFAGTLYRVPLLGGTPQRVLRESVGSRVAFSPDGRRIAFVHWRDDLHTLLKITNLDGTGARELATLGYDDGFSVDGPAWSPDGRTIVASTSSYNGSRRISRLVAIDVATGAQRPFAAGRWNWIGQITWLADGSGIVLTAWSSDSDAMSDQVWLVKYPGGESRRITSDISGYLGLGVSTDAKTIAASVSIPSVNFWVAPAGDFAQAQKITNGSGDLYSNRLGAQWTPDGHIVYAAREGGKPSIRIMDADGAHQRQLTSADGADFQPAVSPDGRAIAFISSRAGRNQLWRMDIDGSNPRLLAPMTAVAWPSFSRDGRWIVCEATDAGKPYIWRVPAGGGTPFRVAREPARMPAVSPDGRTIACLVPNPQPGPSRLTLLDFDSGRVIRQFDALVRNTPALAWSPDGSAIMYAVTRGGVSNLWIQPIDGSAPGPLTDWKADLIQRFASSRDGRLLCERGTTVSDVILIRDGAPR